MIPHAVKMLLPLACFTVFLNCPAGPEERNALLLATRQGEKSIPVLEKALDSPDRIARRTAMRALGEFGPAVENILKRSARENSDPLVRRGALAALLNFRRTDEMLDLLEKMVTDEKDPVVRAFAIEVLAADRPATGRRGKLLLAASEGASPEIRAIIARATWPFFRNTVLLRERSNWDAPIELTASVPLPLRGWKFAKDLKGDMHEGGCYSTGFDDSGWKTVEIGKFWEHFIGIYDGIGWYRLTFTAPAKPEHYNAVELRFSAVDENGWVWLNGIYIGQHDLGKSGWNVPFSLDVTREIEWGKPNQLTVRVLDSGGAGGIWKPVHLDILN